MSIADPRKICYVGQRNRCVRFFEWFDGRKKMNVVKRLCGISCLLVPVLYDDQAWMLHVRFYVRVCGIGEQANKWFAVGFCGLSQLIFVGSVLHAVSQLGCITVVWHDEYVPI